MMHFGNQMKKHGIYFAEAIKEEGEVPGKIFIGYDFSQSNENTLFPIFKFENKEFVEVYPNKW